MAVIVLYKIRSTKNLEIEKKGRRRDHFQTIFWSRSDFEPLVVGPRAPRDRTFTGLKHMFTQPKNGTFLGQNSDFQAQKLNTKI